MNQQHTGVILKTPDEIIIMREAGRIVAKAHEAMHEALRPGISTAELDKIAESVIREHGATPVFMGQQRPGAPSFPATITASINDELIHGIPSPSRIIKEGDVVSLDTGCTYQGFVGDAARTWIVGEAPEAVHRLARVTQEAFFVGFALCKPGTEIKDIARAIQDHIEGHGYGVVREYTGHGVGRKLWEEPEVPNWWPKNARNRHFKSITLQAGMTIAIEPMVTIGRPDVKELADKWTVASRDRSLCAHYENTILVTDGEPQILTAL